MKKEELPLVTMAELQAFVEKDRSTQKHFRVSKETYEEVKAYMLDRYDDLEPVGEAVLRNVEKHLGLKFTEMYFRDLVCPNKHPYTFFQFVMDALHEHGGLTRELLTFEGVDDDVVIGVNNIHAHICHVCGETVNGDKYHFTDIARTAAKECAYIGFPYACIRF